MQNKALIPIALVAILVLGTGLFFAFKKPDVSLENAAKSYSSSQYKFAFSYPEGYYLKENANVGTATKPQLAVVLVEDTAENRNLLDGTYTGPGREGPISITVEVYQNPENLSPDAWIKKNSNWMTSFSEPQLVTVAGKSGVLYTWDGLYVGKTAAVTSNGYIYLFSVTELSPDDQIAEDFEEMLETVSFEEEAYQRTPTSADNAPEGSLHNIRVPGPVAAVRTLVAEETNTPEGEVIILSAYEKEWTDSCLGLGGPAESCLFVMTPGYEVTVTAKGREYVYRTNMDATVIREEK